MPKPLYLRSGLQGDKLQPGTFLRFQSSIDVCPDDSLLHFICLLPLLLGMVCMTLLDMETEIVQPLVANTRRPEERSKPIRFICALSAI